MFAYCLNNPVTFLDNSGNAAHICFSPDGRQNYAPWRNDSPGGGGWPQGIHTSQRDYGSVADKFYTVRALKYLFNTDEQVVINAEYFAFYKGVFVVKVPSMGTSGLSIGVIFLGSKVNSPSVVQHEFGHVVQLRQLGLGDYLTWVGIPSYYYYRKTMQGEYTWDQYYDRPWELIADFYGGVNRTYSEDAFILAQLYWTIAQFCS